MYLIFTNYLVKFADLNKVQILVLDNNGLEELPDNAFAGMDDLEYLYIRENKWETTNKNIFIYF